MTFSAAPNLYAQTTSPFNRAWNLYLFLPGDHKLPTKHTIYGGQNQPALKWTQVSLAWDADSFRTVQRAKLMYLSTTTILIGILGAVFPEDDPGAIPIDIASLVEQAQQGDREAVATLYRIYVKRIYRYVAFRTTSAHDAEDLTAEVFMRMVEALPTYEVTGAPFEAWLYRIAASRVSDFYRSKANSRNEQLHENLADETVLFEDKLIEGQTVETLRRAMQRLPEDYQVVLIMRFVERKSHEEVAMLLGKSVAAVKTIQHRALSQLTQMLGSNHKVRHYLRGKHE
jgi:RNA polymerase sigma-70 factor, ECF subfamily